MRDAAGEGLAGSWRGKEAMADLRERRWLALPVVIFCLIGCGKKGPPFIPVRRDLPVLEYFRALPARGGVMLEWREKPQVSPPPEGSWDRYRLYREAPGGAPGEIDSRKFEGKGGALHRHLDLKPWGEAPPRYRLRLVASGGRAGFSPPVVSLPAGSGPTAVAPPAVEVLDGRLGVSWQPPADSPGEGITVSYNLFRREGTGTYHLAKPLSPEPLASTAMVDEGLANGRIYCYAVTALRHRDGELLGESALSSETCASPRDTTPPAAPSGLVAAFGGGMISLTWSENAERDVAGYHVYRALPGETPVRLDRDGVRGVAYFADESALPGTLYRYHVTAFDRREPPNESAPSASVEVTAPASPDSPPRP